eukprot:1406631-Prymnesium_polylepis.5
MRYPSHALRAAEVAGALAAAGDGGVGPRRLESVEADADGAAGGCAIHRLALTHERLPPEERIAQQPQKPQPTSLTAAPVEQPSAP